MDESMIVSPNIKRVARFNIFFDKIEEINPLFSKCFIRILYPGLNPNRVFISKEVAEEMAKTLYNIPIVGEYLESIEDYQDHGGKIEIDASTKEIKYIHTTKPYGVVPSNTDIKWELVTEEDGQIREYLTCWGYLWTGRYPEAKRIIELGNPQSMELDEETLEGFWVKKGRETYFEITKATFSALAILGEQVEPAFESASISTYYHLNPTEFSKKYNKMLRVLKENCLLVNKQSIDFQKEKELESININNKKGGNKVDKTKLSININFELSFDDIRGKLYQEVRKNVGDSWDFMIQDIYEDRAILYVWDSGEYYRQYYTIEEDEIILGDKIKVVIRDLTVEEEAALAVLKEELDKTTESLNAFQKTAEEATKKIAEFEALKVENESLIEFKEAKEKAEKEEVIAKFSAILEEEDLTDCRKNLDSLSKEEIESKLSVIAVKNMNFSKNINSDGNLIPELNHSDNTPGWLKIVDEHKNS